MRIQLASRDADLNKLCRDILTGFPEEAWELSTVMVEDPNADLSIWDYAPDLPIPPGVAENPAKHLFLVHRKHIGEFRHAAPFAEASILLKPATRAALTAFVGHAVSVHADRNDDASSLRADRDDLLQCLIEANLKLQEYDQDRTNFLARGIHDFRAPLTAINGYCGLLLSESLGTVSEEQKEVLQRMQRSAKRLSRMASAMFQLSVGRHVKRRLELRRSDLHECLNQALHEVSQQIEAKQISVSLDLEPEPEPLYFEQGQIEQLIVNLLDNACKFTPKHGEIEIHAGPYFWDRRVLSSSTNAGGDRRRRQTREPNAYRLDIRNSGAPVPLEHLKSIFEEYMSYAGGRDRSGGGLGLAICRMIATQHDGAVWAENTERGPRFTFVLPVHSQPPDYNSENDQKEYSKYAEVL